MFYNSDVCQGVPELPRSMVKYLRVFQQDAKTYSTWQKTFVYSGPAVSAVQTEAVKRIVSTVPVEPDGSVYFEAPAGQALFFQLLDEQQRALHTMRSFTGVLPGERRGCVGCHSTHSLAPPNQAGLASQHPPTVVNPPSWGSESISYERFVQPWNAGHIPTAIHFEGGRVAWEELSFPHDKPLAVQCASGNRSMSVISVLQRRGYHNVLQVEGGFTKWQMHRFEVVRNERD